MFMSRFKIYMDITRTFVFNIWLPPRDSNPDMPLQRRLSYH